MKHGADQAGLARSVERPFPRRHFEDDGAEGEDVAPRVDFPALELLGRHVGKRPQNLPVCGERRGLGRPVQDRRALGPQLRQPEVEQLRA